MELIGFRILHEGGLHKSCTHRIQNDEGKKDPHGCKYTAMS
jgi:hypothetical protein